MLNDFENATKYFHLTSLHNKISPLVNIDDLAGSLKKHIFGPVQWLAPVILALWEAEVGRSPEVRSLSPTWPTR